ncbi:DNA polymerase III subunit gamma/tau [Leminorella grimontii]|uniref:DNA polymerase III subunit gamma/tau n=1 Tax=Leminorella grimontii TaxID=82981 RepID=A0AAV5N7B1_9GAMM|nr:DNA polymerase III subunit gamma/tau [Leminorella grimontii]KFC97197.1 DNA polymerase III gamma/tau subunits [Leminorella grimontii ATCC 33999 = DSM 5078]GKX56959.1 DNA polymerase III subunit gamma/tau [Leminorella grimontii]VFS57422.1 DNA polymerase III subunit tau [Leminorella grimontii]
MSYQVLARKWRPQSFADVVGQEHVLTAIANGLSLGRIHHAYLFSGTRGVGKTSIARLLAKGLNCESGVTATPCGKCANCREIEEGRFVDLLEIDAASRTKVEDTRELLDNVQYAPARGRFKVYLIDEVHMLSRHSFNALLKTLEEPPEHVKFLLATTDPQKLPVTILSRCLQFHLKALDVEQIKGQLEKVLQEEKIPSEPKALSLLARAAQGSMRDALSLTDQAIAMGDGRVETESVSAMLGTLDEEYTLSLIEALVHANGEALMAQVNQIAAKGIDWESLLVETLALLHQIAMVQLLPSALDPLKHNESRMRELARQIAPQDLQLYYQTLLVGRKELPYAPDGRMGVEMTLLRALAFHPKSVGTLAEAVPQPVPTSISAPPVSGAAPVNHASSAPQPHRAAAVPFVDERPPAPAPEAYANSRLIEPPPREAPVGNDGAANLPPATAQMLQARSQLRRQQESSETKKSKPATPAGVKPASSVLERLAAATENKGESPTRSVKSSKPEGKKESYRWKAQHDFEAVSQQVATPKALRSALEHEKTPELAAKLVEESLTRDAWAAEVAELTLPKLVQQLALNAFKQQVSESEVCLHLRPGQRHLNSASAQQALAEAMSQRAGHAITLTIVEDDDRSIKTPLECRQAIYEEKLAQAKTSIIEDGHIQTLCRYFDAELDEDSIRPV